MKFQRKPNVVFCGYIPARIGFVIC